MITKYVRALENRGLNPRTGETWKVEDVPPTWREAVVTRVEADGYIINDDGTVDKKSDEE